MSERAAESTHWYWPTGEPAYQLPNKSKPGELRNTTLRDAKMLGLRPSVTTIIGQADKPGLNKWLFRQGVMSALTLPRIEGETEDEWLARIEEDASDQAKKARERGTQIHEWVQQGFEGKPIPHEGEVYHMIAQEAIGDGWVCEKSFATNRYAGKVDLHKSSGCHLNESEGVVIDIKTKDTPIDKCSLWPEHWMQLSAYRVGLGIPYAKCGILFLSTLEVKAKVLWVDEVNLKQGFEMFVPLCDYYYAKTGLI